ncbi:hydantoinase B/oxoprolinase family protein [Teichococcus oryzae]|uniref:Uncharacterized protein n=1 Tax=Teichococcus oryzae TaxID=1608942 RepID=A0A5B2TJT5_9PROT|nr:hydantoinase B/oxoprolinase family protein [Pseudoroseomonas oryzae]KAA2214741.1 hypothetical protein F0Q34_03355 [Pseudoroseomonas oryzae]
MPRSAATTPVRRGAGEEILFFGHRRGHHALVSGLVPGSALPDATILGEKGVVIDDVLPANGGCVLPRRARPAAAGASRPGPSGGNRGAFRG